jgi:hypothetical protein
VLITDIEPAPLFVIYAYAPFAVKAAPAGLLWTATVAVTVSVPVFITETVLLPEFVT